MFHKINHWSNLDLEFSLWEECWQVIKLFSWVYESSDFALSCTIFWHFYFLFLNIFYWLCYYSCPIFFSPLFPSALNLHPTSISTPPLNSCPWVIHISSLASSFPIVFLTSPYLFGNYHLCFLFPVPFPPFSPLSLPTDNPPCDFHSCDSVPILIVCLVYLFI